MIGPAKLIIIDKHDGSTANHDAAEVFQVKMQTNRAIQILLAAVTAAFLTVAYFQIRHITAQQSENLDLVEFVNGEYLVGGGYFAYSDVLTNERISGGRNDRFLNITIAGQDSASFNGCGPSGIKARCLC